MKRLKGILLSRVVAIETFKSSIGKDLANLYLPYLSKCEDADNWYVKEKIKVAKALRRRLTEINTIKSNAKCTHVKFLEVRFQRMKMNKNEYTLLPSEEIS